MTRRHSWPGRHLRLIGHEEVVQMPANKPGGGWLTTDNVDDLLPVERPGVPQEGFTSVVVIVLAIHELPVQTPIGPDRITCHAGRMQGGVTDRPASEGARTLPHIGLGVVTHAHGEQL